MRPNFLAVLLITLFAGLLIISSCQNNGPEAPENTPVPTATPTSTCTITPTSSNTPTVTATPTATMKVTIWVDNFEDNNMENMILDDGGYNSWTGGFGDGGAVTSYGVVPSAGGDFGSYALCITGTATTVSTDFMYSGRIVLLTHTEKVGSGGLDITEYTYMQIGYCGDFSGPAGTIGIVVQVLLIDSDYDYVHYDFNINAYTPFSSGTFDLSNFTPGGAYTAASVLNDVREIDFNIYGRSSNQNDVINLLFCLDNIYFW